MEKSKGILIYYFQFSIYDFGVEIATACVENPRQCRGLTGKENPGEARVCFLIDPQINLGAKYKGNPHRAGWGRDSFEFLVLSFEFFPLITEY